MEITINLVRWLNFSQVGFPQSNSQDSESCYSSRNASNRLVPQAILRSIGFATKYPKHAGENHVTDTEELLVKYNRSLDGYQSYPTTTDRGFYTGRRCNTNIDHVVSMKDAHLSGARRWKPQDGLILLTIV